MHDCAHTLCIRCFQDWFAMDIENLVQETFSNYRMSSVLVLQRTTIDNRCSVSAGNGFVIGKGESFYLVMTCRHCVVSVGPNVTLSVRLSGKTTEYEAEKLYHSDLADIAIIKVKGVPKSEDCPILNFGDSENIAPKANIVQLGYVFEPNRMILNPSVAPGIFVALRGKGDVVFTGAGMCGISGSPILLNFKVIGVQYAVSYNDQMIHAVSSNSVEKVMKTWLGLPPEDGSTIEQMINTILAKI